MRTLIEKRNEKEARLIRMYGEYGEVTVPEEEEGCRITEIGAYCFSEKPPQGIEERTDTFSRRPLCGTFLEKVTIPDGVDALGDYAFYGCRNLRELTIGSDLRRIGNGAFMNCTNLKRLNIRGSVREKTGLRRILAQLREEILVSFIGPEKEEARILFPGFTESYEALEPAHIFGLHIEGEGKRAREQFREDVFDPAGYDKVFAKACSEEEPFTLLRMAACRLQFPVGLSEEAKNRYLEYFRAHEEAVMQEIIDRRLQEELVFLLESGLISADTRRFAIRRASAAGYLEGNFLLITRGNHAE